MEGPGCPSTNVAAEDCRTELDWWRGLRQLGSFVVHLLAYLVRDPAKVMLISLSCSSRHGRTFPMELSCCFHITMLMTLLGGNLLALCYDLEQWVSRSFRSDDAYE